MVRFEKIVTPNFSSQLGNKVLYAEHDRDISVSYKSTYTLKYVIDGAKNYSFGKDEVKVSKNQYLFLDNNRTINTEAKKGTVGLSFFLSPELISNVYSNLYGKDKSSIEFLECPQTRSDDRIGNWLNQSAHLLTNEPSVSAFQMDDLFIRLSEIVVQEQVKIEDTFASLEIIKYNTKKELLRFISRSKEFIHDNYDAPITLSILSKNIGVSKYYLHRLFTEMTGSTPVVYITRVRLSKAKEQLRTSGASILEIAMACGFDSTSYFSNTFKKHFGVSPTEYRKSL